MTNNKFWEDPSRVESFAAKAADHRLVELVKKYPSPSQTMVRDLGCAAGRNSVFMAECGFNIWAVDFSRAMIEKTQKSITPYMEAKEIERRINVGRMDDLSWAQNGFFDLIIALGIYHNAQGDEEFENAISESHRILKRGGKLLMATFAPGTVLPDMKLSKISKHIWKDENHGNLYLLTGTELDRKLKEFYFSPVTKTATVEKSLEKGRRITVNALYEKQ